VCWARERHPERPRATYRRTQGIGYLFGSYDFDDDGLHGLYRRSRTGSDFVCFLTELRSHYPLDEHLFIVVDNLSTHTTPDVLAWLPDNNAEFVLVPTHSSWLNRIEGRFAATRSFVIAGSDYPDHDTIERELPSYTDWSNQRRHDPKLRRAEKRGCLHWGALGFTDLGGNGSGAQVPLRAAGRDEHLATVERQRELPQPAGWRREGSLPRWAAPVCELFVHEGDRESLDVGAYAHVSKALATQQDAQRSSAEEMRVLDRGEQWPRPTKRSRHHTSRVRSLDIEAATWVEQHPGATDKRRWIEHMLDHGHHRHNVERAELKDCRLDVRLKHATPEPLVCQLDRVGLQFDAVDVCATLSEQYQELAREAAHVEHTFSGTHVYPVRELLVDAPIALRVAACDLIVSGLESRPVVRFDLLGCRSWLARKQATASATAIKPVAFTRTVDAFIATAGEAQHPAETITRRPTCRVPRWLRIRPMRVPVSA
jgi:hypothetical protein